MDLNSSFFLFFHFTLPEYRQTIALSFNERLSLSLFSVDWLYIFTDPGLERSNDSSNPERGGGYLDPVQL